MSTITAARKAFVFLVCASTLVCSSHAANIIFDLNGVLLRQNTLMTAWQIGFWHFLGIYNPFSIEKTLFKFLDLVEPHRPDTPPAQYHGRLMPQILCDWQLGIKTTNQILEAVKEAFKANTVFFDRYGKRGLIRATTIYMFHPERMTRATQLIIPGFKLWRKCRLCINEKGQRAHRIFILSNWDPESFDLLYTHKSIKLMLNQCDGVVVSGQVHLMKPDPAIFEYLFNTYNINPDKELTVFIDDELINIEVAQNLGKANLHCIHCKDFKKVKNELRALNIIA